MVLPELKPGLPYSHCEEKVKHSAIGAKVRSRPLHILELALLSTVFPATLPSPFQRLRPCSLSHKVTQTIKALTPAGSLNLLPSKH